jgi:hypothetical protein
MHMAHIVREMRGVAPTANGFFFFYSKLGFSASISHGLSHTPHRKWRFQSTKSRFIAPVVSGLSGLSGLALPLAAKTHPNPQPATRNPELELKTWNPGFGIW